MVGETVTVRFTGDGKTYQVDGPGQTAVESGRFPDVVAEAIDRLERQEVPEEIHIETDIDGVPGARPRQKDLIERKFSRYAADNEVEIIYKD